MCAVGMNNPGIKKKKKVFNFELICILLSYAEISKKKSIFIIKFNCFNIYLFLESTPKSKKKKKRENQEPVEEQSFVAEDGNYQLYYAFTIRAWI